MTRYHKVRLNKDGDKLRFGNGYVLFRINPYNSPTDDVFVLYPAKHKIIGLFRFVDNDIEVENRYEPKT